MIKIPFSYFGGKRKIAPIIWQGLGNVSNYVEPFCGSLSALLGNPNPAKIETVNDIDCGLTNFWRAVSQDPEGVAKYADYPVSEIDLHARHKWLVSLLDSDFKQKMEDDPDFYNVKAAGFWVYGICVSVGNNWLQPKGLKALPLLSSAGGGIHGLTYNIHEQFSKLQERLKRVRILCGDWKRVVTPAVTYNNVGIGSKDITGVLLDPPYLAQNRDKVYLNDNNIFKEVCDWAVANGDNPRMRIVLCGYEGNHNIPDTWKIYSWKANGGMSGLGNSRGKENSKKETIWFSPSCLEIK